MIDEIKKTREYLDYLECHYNNIQESWRYIKEKCKDSGLRFMTDDYVYGLIRMDVIGHDRSKMSPEEFVQYRRHLFPCEYEKINRDEYLVAWSNHKSKNEHHWQNWTKKAGVHYETFGDAYVVMMVIDWHAMGLEKGDNAKIYYESNRDKIDLPQWAIDFMYKLFSYIYD